MSLPSRHVCMKLYHQGPACCVEARKEAETGRRDIPVRTVFLFFLVPLFVYPRAYHMFPPWKEKKKEKSYNWKQSVKKIKEGKYLFFHSHSSVAVSQTQRTSSISLVSELPVSINSRSWFLELQTELKYLIFEQAWHFLFSSLARRISEALLGAALKAMVQRHCPLLWQVLLLCRTCLLLLCDALSHLVYIMWSTSNSSSFMLCLFYLSGKNCLIQGLEHSKRERSRSCGVDAFSTSWSLIISSILSLKSHVEARLHKVVM